jgi:ricin-type beta-trefoil lectin protein
MHAVFGKALAAVVVAGAATIIPATPALAATGVFISNQDGRCLDADISSPTHNGTKVQVWQCIAGGRNQVWTWYTDGTIRTAWDGRCLDEDIAGGTHNGSKAQLWDCNGQYNQKWDVHSDGTITSRQDGRCLDEDIAGGTRNGTKVQVWDCNTWPNQKWHR